MGPPHFASSSRFGTLWRPDENQAAHLRTYRIYAVLAGVLVLSFWGIYRLEEPEALDPLWMRIVLAVVTFAALGLSFRFVAIERRFIQVMRGLLYAYTVWFIGLLAANAFSPNYALGLLFVIAAIAVAISTGLDRPQPLIYYLAFASGVTTIVAVLVDDAATGTVGRLIFVGLVVSIGIVIYVAASGTIRAQTMLAASEQKYRTLFSSASDAILVMDPVSLRIVEANAKAAALYGYTRKEIVGLHAEELAREQVEQWFERVPSGNVEVVHYRRDGTPIDLLVSTAIIHYESHAAFLSIHRDMTERLRTMQQLAGANRALLMRNQELREFTTVASHDLQEPLRKIRTFADLIEREHGEAMPEDARPYFARIQAIAAHMSRLITDLLSFTHITSRPEPFQEIDLGAMMDTILSELAEPINESGAHCEACDLPVIEASPAQIHRLLRHLVENAIRFRRPDVPPRVRISAEIIGEEAEKTCRLTVTDNGIGFDEKYLPRVFGPFEQLDRRGSEGTGMGLAICKRIVERHAGTITARSEPGEGTTFIVELPVRQTGAMGDAAA